MLSELEKSLSGAWVVLRRFDWVGAGCLLDFRAPALALERQNKKGFFCYLH